MIERRDRREDEINAERRKAYREANPLPERPCIVCGRPFAKRPDALVCGPACRERRKAGRRRRARLKARLLAEEQSHPAPP